MNDIHRRLAALGVTVPEILVPRSGTDLRKWAVVACDQFSQDRNFWEILKTETSTAPSTLNLIFPEVYLGDNREARIADIQTCMRTYLDTGVFAPPRRECVYLERRTARHPRRRGLILAVDLEQYDWNPGARLLIRTTEGTIKERLLPRMEIRRNAPLECPHILLLIDDDEDFLIPGLGERAKKNTPLYETSLMGDSGAVSGWALDTERDWLLLAEGLERLAQKASARYGGEAPFLYAMGDGNHSLATAREVWEEYKKSHPHDPALMDHPARWALVELENLYDPGISFEPIHRVIFGVTPEAALAALSGVPGLVCTRSGDHPGILGIETTQEILAAPRLQPPLDDLVKAAGASMDYIHGEEELYRLVASSRGPAVGILFPALQQSGLFRTVAETGPLPRKSFSMGSAEEKRFYL
ncbi:MAG: DUF1015 domain-containing protein, partial [Treponema sp.]|nr:DUF1015 domain-containing protein [Treponema sp.]